MKRDKKALTFIEIIISLSLLAIIFIGFAEVLEVGMRSVYRTNQEIIATSLARGMMSEIISKQFCDSSDTNCTGSLGPETGEVRSNNTNTFDDMDDYHNYTDSPPITIGALAEAYW